MPLNGALAKALRPRERRIYASGILPSLVQIMACRRQAIFWTNAGILLIGPLGTNFNEILIKILILSFRKMRLKVSSGKWRPFCLGLNALKLEHGWLVSFHNSMFMSSLIHVISLMLFELIPVGKKYSLLTHWGREKIAAIWQMTLSNAFSWMKIYEFCSRFHWNVFLRFELKIFQHWFR